MPLAPHDPAYDFNFKRLGPCSSLSVALIVWDSIFILFLLCNVIFYNKNGKLLYV